MRQRRPRDPHDGHDGRRRRARPVHARHRRRARRPLDRGQGLRAQGLPEESLLSSGQWILAPTDLNGENPDPSKRPDIVNNSWGGGPGDPFYLATVQAWRAAGIIPVFSSGNPGPFCGEGGSPGDFNEVFSAGATDINDNIADFSGRGPSVFGKVNPDVAAPGVNVMSSVPGGGYEAFAGTSMAAPHVAGTIALVAVGQAGAPRRPKQLPGGHERRPGHGGQPHRHHVRRRRRRRPEQRLRRRPDRREGGGRPRRLGGTLSGTITDIDTSAPIGGADGHRERRRARVQRRHGRERQLLAVPRGRQLRRDRGRVRLRPQDRVGRDDREGPDDRPGLPARRAAQVHRVRPRPASEDGSPIADAQVRAIGTPVPPATTNAAGAYSLVLPIGDYTLHAASGGCTEQGEADISLVDQNITQDFSLFRKLDDFGHGCRPVPFAWVDAQNQSALYGDEFAGRLHLPFDFDFYDQTYSQIWISDNGYVNFAGPDQFNFFPSAIPSPAPPNAAIYAFWQDLAVDATSQIDYATVGTAPNRAFIIEYSRCRSSGRALTSRTRSSSGRTAGSTCSTATTRRTRVTAATPASGSRTRRATTPSSSRSSQGVLDPNTAFRYEHVPSGLVHGVVTDANDGVPIAEPKITATPGGRTTTTDGDGAYTLRLRPGAYTLAATATNYVTATHPATVVDEGDSTIDFSLDAPVAGVDPTEVSATVDFGETTDRNVTLSNTGTGPLNWEAKERDQGVTAPRAARPRQLRSGRRRGGRQRSRPASRKRSSMTRRPVRARRQPQHDHHRPGRRLARLERRHDGPGRLGRQTVASMAIDFAPATPMEPGRRVRLLRHRPGSRRPASRPRRSSASPTQDIGMEYFADLFERTATASCSSANADTVDLVAVVPATSRTTRSRSTSRSRRSAATTGSSTPRMVVGLPARPTGRPDDGHGTIEPFSDAPWLSESPDSGDGRAAAARQVVTLNLGDATLPPGEYHALVVFVTNAPQQTQLPVDVTLTVTLPPEFGGDQRHGHRRPHGRAAGRRDRRRPRDLEGRTARPDATTADDGTYSIVGPAGTWTADYSPRRLRHGHPARHDRQGRHDARRRRGPPRPAPCPARRRPVTFVLHPGPHARSPDARRNPGGHEPLTFIDRRGRPRRRHAASPAAPGVPQAARRRRTRKRPLDERALPAATALATPPAIRRRRRPRQLECRDERCRGASGYTGDVWLSDPIDLIDAHFTAGGSRLGDFAQPDERASGAATWPSTAAAASSGRSTSAATTASTGSTRATGRSSR